MTGKLFASAVAAASLFASCGAFQSSHTTRAHRAYVSRCRGTRSRVRCSASQEPPPGEPPRQKKELSFSSILKAIDKDHYREASESCTYLAAERKGTATTAAVEGNKEGNKERFIQPPRRRGLTDSAVVALRQAASSYFEANRDGPNNGALGRERVQLDAILGANLADFMNELNDTLQESVYTSIRSNWEDHQAFMDDSSLLSVTSATVFAGGGYAGARPAMTSLERDAGLFTVHIDLGGRDDIPGGNDAHGAIYADSLIGGMELPIFGPLMPGEMVIHRASERTSAIIVPAAIHDLAAKGMHSLDNHARRSIFKAAESSRHYALRLVVTARRENNDDSLTPEAPAEERSYWLRSIARFSDDRLRYLTLAGLMDSSDPETHLWLGFDYMSSDGNTNPGQRLRDLNKAVFHLQRASILSPNDPRVQYQLATALSAKMQCEEAVEDDILPVIEALERSTECESAAVKLGVSSVQDLLVGLNGLSENLCRIGDFNRALGSIDRWAEASSVRSNLAIEDLASQDDGACPEFESITANGGEGDTCRVFVRTRGDIAVFEPNDIRRLRLAADNMFASGLQTSRYTMQYEGNSEIHLDDLCASDPVLKGRIDTILQQKIYPLVRSAFADYGDTPVGPLCVYDSIFVRYNGDKAKAAGKIGASQPLHQDGGIYSVNIALNSHEDDDQNGCGFTGGGTFFERLSLCDNAVERPVGPGHAIIHATTQRHAGAPTTSGIRDILVIFLSARKPLELNVGSPWAIERGMRLQSIGKQLRRDKLIPCLQLASNNDPTNSEQRYWLGVHLIQGDMADTSENRWREICGGVEFLEDSIQLNPSDARAHYHLGMAISTRHKYAMRTRRADELPPPKEAAESMIHALETAISLERRCLLYNCPNGINIGAAYLALGDFMLRLKSFDKAMSYLNLVEGAIQESGDAEEEWAKGMMDEVTSMMNFCNEEMAIIPKT